MDRKVWYSRVAADSTLYVVKGELFGFDFVWASCWLNHVDFGVGNCSSFDLVDQHELLNILFNDC